MNGGRHPGCVVWQLRSYKNEREKCMRILHIQAQLPSKTGSGVYFTDIIKGLEDRAQQACLYGYYSDSEWDILPKSKQYQVVFMKVFL